MLIITCIALGLCGVLALGQCLAVAAFSWNMLRHRATTDSEHSLPKAAVILALRGPDPFLDNCLRQLLAQRYPDYTVFLIVDNDEDPVLHDIDRVLAETHADNIVVSVLENRYETCSLKCSALIQAVQDLDESYEVVAFLDGDASPHPTWLSDLVYPIIDSNIAVTYGNRWYVPSDHDWGSWVRYCWNVGAVVQVWLNGITWAGSMAMRADTIEKIGLLDAWRGALSVDATVHRQLHEHKRRVKFVPSVMMVNREDIALPQFIRWVQRQLVAAKSCGTGWLLVGLHALNLAGTQLLALAMLIAGCLTHNSLIITLSAIGLAMYWGSSFLSIAATEWTIRRKVRENGEDIRWSFWSSTIQLWLAMLLTQIVYPFALSSALFRRRVSWRGVEYEIRGVGDILMRNYHPYSAAQDNSMSESVI